jgi:nucleoside-diphosphate-sugar epimerase
MTDHQFRCLVTGGAGFVGSHVAERLSALGHPTTVVDNLSTGNLRNLDSFRDRLTFVPGDLTDPAVCRRAVETVDVVFHLAALPSVPRSMSDPWASHEHNVNATVQLLLASRDAGVRRFVYSSSSSVYGDTPTLPKVESMELQPRSPYAAAKLAGEQYVLAFARAGMFEGVALRYFNVFGPRQDPNSAYAAVIPAFLTALIEGHSANVYGDGHQTRDFTYVDNVVDANLLAAMAPADRVSGQAVNIGAGQRTSLRELVEVIEAVTGHSLAIEELPARVGDVHDSLAGLERAHVVLGFSPSVTLEEGLRRTWAWVRADRETALTDRKAG